MEYINDMFVIDIGSVINYNIVYKPMEEGIKSIMDYSDSSDGGKPPLHMHTDIM